MSYEEYQRKERRREILILLEQVPGVPKVLNADLIQEGLRPTGLGQTRSDIIRELNWLADRALVSFVGGSEDFVVVEITQRGRWIAQGKDRQEGVAELRSGS